MELLAKNWLSWDKNAKTRAEVQKLVDEGNEREFRACFEGKLAFGTAGVRTRMGAGFARLNDLTIIQLSHGLARHLLNTKKGGQKGIVVGYDGRHNSRRFAELATNVFICNGIQVQLFSEVVPTPVVSFAVVELGCDAGVMITASHNPKEYNGFKAYWENGAQILAPHDTEICRIVHEEPEPKSDYWDTDKHKSSPLLQNADPVLEHYLENESSICRYYSRELNSETPLRITYSAFHGVGAKFARLMLEKFGFHAENIFHVKEQDEPNPDFPTVQFPNPEEGHRVLQLCFETASRNNSTLILANDPDADRLQIAEAIPERSGEWHVFSGNEMGALLTWWVWTNWRRLNPDADPSRVYVLNSAVSSLISATIARKEGFRIGCSLTGFKWIGNLAHKLRSEGNTVILCWEESIGFAPGSTLDKDGVSSAAVFAEMAAWLLREKHMTLRQQLAKIFEQYGQHLLRSSYWVVPSSDVTARIFADLRAAYPKQLGQSGAVKFVRDLTTGYDNSQPDNKAVLPKSTSSEMVTFTLANGSTITLRASGTEPKIKYYIELVQLPTAAGGDKKQEERDPQAALDQLESDVVATLLQPEKYGLKARD